MNSQNENYDLEIEQTILGAMLQNNDNFYKFLNLSEKDFFLDTHQKIYKKITQLIDEGLEANITTLSPFFSENFHSGTEHEVSPKRYFFHLHTQGSGVVSLVSLIEILQKLKRARDFQNFIQKYQDKVTINTDIDSCLTELESTLFQPSKRIKIRKEKEVVADIAESLKTDLPCFSTGYPSLDKALSGGLYKTKSYCLIAREKTGKTATLGSISYHLSKAKVKHLYVAVEMGADEIHKRRMAYQINRNPIAFYDTELRKDTLFIQDICKLLNKEDNYTIYADAAGVHFNDLKRLILSCIKKYKIEGVIIDYLQIIGGESPKENKSDFYARVAQWIADIGRSENIFTLSAAQENADGDARGSKGIHAAMDILLLMKRPDDESKRVRWFQTKNSRYTVSCKIGTEEKPSFQLPKTGVFLEEIDELSAYANNQMSMDIDEETF